MTLPLTKTWTLEGFLAEVKEVANQMPDRSYAFLLGAGASKASGIPTGSELVDKWLEELQVRLAGGQPLTSVEEWATADVLGISGFEHDRRAEFYSEVFERRFQFDHERGYAFLESVMEGKSPSIGYRILANILARTQHRVIITTNFDDLAADALRTIANVHPLVCGHELLTSYIRTPMRRPLVAKIHRDLLLAPRNSPQEVSNLPNTWKATLRKLVKQYVIIAIGYGGNDGSLMDLLQEIDPTDYAGPMFWCHLNGDDKLNSRVLKLLSTKSGIMVPIKGFDDVMEKLNIALGPS